MNRKILLGLLFCALLFTTAAQDEKSYRADHFDVDVDVQQDRSLLVEETVTFRFTGGPLSFVFRELPTDHTDDITNIVAGVDGVPWPQGDGPGQAEITGRDPIGWHHGLSTLLDLAGHGLIQIEQIAEAGLLRSAEFTVTLLNRPGGLRPHKQALIDMLFTDKSGVERVVVTLSEVGKLITSSRWKKFTETLEDEAGQAGLTDPAVTNQKGRLIGWGIAVMLVALVAAGMSFLLLNTFGAWPFVTVGAVLLVGFIAMITGASLSPLSDKGAQLAAAFEPFRRFLKDVSKGKNGLARSAVLRGLFALRHGLWLGRTLGEGPSKIRLPANPILYPRRRG